MPTTAMTASVDIPLAGGWASPVIDGTGMMFEFVCGRHLGSFACANFTERVN